MAAAHLSWPILCPQCDCSTARLSKSRATCCWWRQGANAAVESPPDTKGGCSGGCVTPSLSGSTLFVATVKLHNDQPQTSVVYTKKCLLLPKSPGVPADLDQPQLALAGPIVICCQLRVEGTMPALLWACSSSSMSAGAVLRATAESPQRQKCARGSAAWSGTGHVAPSYSLQTRVERSANVATEAPHPRPAGAAGLETRHHFCNPPTREGRQLASCLMAIGWRQNPASVCSGVCIPSTTRLLLNSRTSPVRLTFAIL